MYPRKPLSHGEQLARLKIYLRRARTDLQRKYDEFFKATKGRRDCPLEVQVRRRAVDNAQSIVGLLEACLGEVQRQEAMMHAPFKPGDRIEIERQKGEAFDSLLVIDVLPDKKTRYCYECIALTKHGSMYKRGGNARVWPNASTAIRASEAPLNAEGAWESEYFRRCAETSRVLSMEKGDIRLFEAKKTALGLVHYRRKDMLDPLAPETQ
jgi:hypothetical protein